jgi:carboxymethylenebutenolidase
VPTVAKVVPAELSGAGGTLGVVLVHDIYGRGPYLRTVADALLSAGVPSASVDLFGGQVPATVEEGMRLREALTDDHVLATLEEARGSLLSRLTGPARVGTLGFCMGGGVALLGACHRPFDFAVDFYGRVARADDVAGLRGPVLLLLASEDERITPWAFAELLPAMNRAQKRVTVELFPGVRHAFHRPDGPTYDARAAAEAWRRTLAFLTDLDGGARGPSKAQS